jgi:cbb3-type cytochrome oxidase subunit 1
MEWFIKAFIRASLLWFAAGIVLGVLIGVYPEWVIYMPAHAHMNVVGFLTMLVFGVGYQLLPRLFGHPLHSPRLAGIHLVLANAGLLVMVGGFFARPGNAAAARWVIGAGGTIYTVGALFWVYNLWRTFDAADARARERTESTHRPLPTRHDD